MACVRLKRHLSDEPCDAIAVSLKKRRLLVAGGRGGDDDADDHVKAVFRFAGTVKSKDECVDSHISYAVIKEYKQLTQEYRRNHGPKCRLTTKASRLKKAQAKQKVVSRDARYKMVCALRGVDTDDTCKRETCDGDGDEKGTFAEAASLLYKLFDAEEISKEQDASSKLASKDVVTCNGVTMVVEETVKGKPLAENYVYDLYYLNDSNVDLEFLKEPVSIEPWTLSDGNQFYESGGSDSELDEEEDDENDENNWRNDYPDEDDDFEKEYDCYRDYDFMDDALLDKLSVYKIEDGFKSSDEDSMNDYTPEEADVQLHGTTYAAYKARMKHYVDGEDVKTDLDGADVLSDAKSANLFQ